MPKGIDLDRILCKKTEHALRNDWTVAHDKKLYQVDNNIRAKKVTVEERIDGSTIIIYKNKVLKYKEIINRPKQVKEKLQHIFKSRKIYVPSKDHPWKIAGSAHYQQYQQKEKFAQIEKELLLTTT